MITNPNQHLTIETHDSLQATERNQDSDQVAARRFREAERLINLSVGGRHLYGRLWHARRQLAALEGVPAFHILTNQLILLLSESQPKTIEALGAIRGMGRIRLAKYGEVLLKVLLTHGAT